MTSIKSFVYSKAAATRILGTEVVNTVPDSQHLVIWCWLPKGQKAISVPKAKFKEHFAEYRRQEGEKVNPMIDPKDETLWYVSKYQVTVHPDCLTCTCQDWKSQSAIGIKKPTCKHCYSVLYQLGCNSLAEYLEAKGSAKATNQESDSLSPTSSSVPQLPTLPQWVLYWESYGRDRAGKPLETAETKLNRKPTDSEVWELRRNGHSKGFKLVSLEQVKEMA